MNPKVPFIWKRPHHLYHGIAIAAYSAVMWYVSIDNWMYVSIPVWQSFILLGAAIAIDDAIEHTITGSTPFRLLYDKIIYPILIEKFGRD